MLLPLYTYTLNDTVLPVVVVPPDSFRTFFEKVCLPDCPDDVTWELFFTSVQESSLISVEFLKKGDTFYVAVASSDACTFLLHHFDLADYHDGKLNVQDFRRLVLNDKKHFPNIRFTNDDGSVLEVHLETATIHEDFKSEQHSNGIAKYFQLNDDDQKQSFDESPDDHHHHHRNQQQQTLSQHTTTTETIIESPTIVRQLFSLLPFKTKAEKEFDAMQKLFVSMQTAYGNWERNPCSLIIPVYQGDCQHMYFLTVPPDHFLKFIDTFVLKPRCPSGITLHFTWKFTDYRENLILVKKRKHFRANLSHNNLEEYIQFLNRMAPSVFDADEMFKDTFTQKEVRRIIEGDGKNFPTLRISSNSSHDPTRPKSCLQVCPMNADLNSYILRSTLTGYIKFFVKGGDKNEEENNEKENNEKKVNEIRNVYEFLRDLKF